MSVVGDDFGPVVEVFTRNVRERGDDGASLCVEVDGEPVVDLRGSDHVTGDLQVIRSVSKAVCAMVAWVVHERGVVDLDAPVAEAWPEFAVAGKAAITGRMLLAHTAGLPALAPHVDVHAALQWEPAVEALAAQRPVWEPGASNGYHDLTFGWLVGELLRRASGRTVGRLVAEVLSYPLQLDLWIGAPREVVPRVRGLLRDRAEGPRQVLPDGTRSVLGAGAGLDVSAVEHTPEYLSAEVPAANAVADARSLARLFSAFIGAGPGPGLVPERTVRDASALQSEGEDRVVGWFRRYGSGFMLPDPTRPMGGERAGAFGHYGQGGSLAFGHLELGTSFAYLTRRDRSYLGADPRSAELAATTLACVRRSRGRG